MSARRAYAEALAAACEQRGWRSDVVDWARPTPAAGVVVLDLSGPVDAIRAALASLVGERVRIIGLGGDPTFAGQFDVDTWVATSAPIDALLDAVEASRPSVRAAPALAGAPASTTVLTPREQEVLGELLAGGDTMSMAERLAISPRTFSTHVQRVLAKLGVNSRAQAAAWALRNGYLPDATTTRAAS